MEAAQNNKEDTTYRQGALQLEITGLDAPPLSNTKKRGLNRENLPPTEPLLFKKRPLEMIATGAPVISPQARYRLSSEIEIDRDSSSSFTSFCWL